MTITILDGFTLNPGDLSWDSWENYGELRIYDRTSPSELIQRAKDSEVLITNKVVIDASTIEELPKLKYIGVLATGYNVVDTEAAAKKGIVVTNIPAYSTMSVAQHVFALLLSVTDHAEHYATEVANGKWSHSKDFCFRDTQLIELAGKRFGIIGFGNIGSAVANIALAFGMEVAVYTSKDESQLPVDIKKVSLEELFHSSDIISLHCPLTESTRNIINSHTIEKMKDGVILINTGRGPLVDEQAVANALHSGKIFAFCADVLSSEPPSASNPLLHAPNTFITPHIAWATKEARIRLMDTAIENLRQYLSGNPINKVN